MNVAKGNELHVQNELNCTSWTSEALVQICISYGYINIMLNRSSHRRCSLKKGVLKNLAKFTGKTPIPETSACNFIKKEILAQIFFL